MSHAIVGGWATPASVKARLMKRWWDSGDLLRLTVDETGWEPVQVPVKGPTAGQLGEFYGEASRWSDLWTYAAQGSSSAFTMVTKTIGGRRVGQNSIPAALQFEQPEDLIRFLGRAPAVRQFVALLDETLEVLPGVFPALMAKPLRVLDNAARWDDLVATTRWIGENADRNCYLRQIDVPGVDTKFIESHKLQLAWLLDATLPAELVNGDVPVTAFARRYGFLPKPVYCRVRLLDEDAGWEHGWSEINVRVEELAATPPVATTVFIVENEITFLAFPPTPNAIAIFGKGFSVGELADVSWLHTRRLFYWGDIDTHGLVILDGARAHFPHTMSLLMDEATLLAHRSQWVKEAIPSTRLPESLQRLNGEERALYTRLLRHQWGVGNVRLEQERVTYPAIVAAVSAVNG